MFAATVTQTSRPNAISNSAGDRLIQLAKAPEGLAHIPYDESDIWVRKGSKSDITLVQQRYWNTPQSSLVKGIVEHAPSQTRIVAWARIDNRAEVQSELAKDLESLCRTDDGLILAAYLQWGERFCEKLIGDFAFAIVDQRQQSIVLGRDHTGVKPLYYYFDGKQFAFATSQGVLNKLPGLDLSLSEKWLASYLVSESCDWGATVYRRINKLPPAHTLTFSENKVTLRRYFEFSIESDLILGSDEEYVEAYRETLHQAVACRVSSDHPIGSESSGGLDSSTITALASRYMQQPSRRLHTYGYDEAARTAECIIAISQSNPMAMTHFASKTRGKNNDIFDEFNHCHGGPLEHINATAHHVFYEDAQKRGVRTLLSGFGGDEFVTSAAPVALVEFWRNQDWQLFFSRQRGNTLTKPLHTLRWLYLYYRFNNHSIASRSLQKAATKKWQYHLLKTSSAEQYGLQATAQNVALYDGGQTLQNGFALNNRWSPAMTARYENCTLMAAHYGIDYRWPLMDIRLLKLFLSIPASQKLGPGLVGRYLHRRAVADILPEFIAWKGKSMSAGAWRQQLHSWIDKKPLIDAFKPSVNKPLSPNANSQQSKVRPVQNSVVTSKPGLYHQSNFEPHPLIAPLIDSNKVARSLKLLTELPANGTQQNLINGHLGRLKRLNQWLKFQQSTDSTEA